MRSLQLVLTDCCHGWMVYVVGEPDGVEERRVPFHRVGHSRPEEHIVRRAEVLHILSGCQFIKVFLLANHSLLI